MAKKFSYKGHELESLQNMELSELMKLMNSRQRRSLKRGLSDGQKRFLLKLRQNKDKDKLMRTHLRDMVILPEMVGAKIGIHNGKEFRLVIITEAMIGHYLGEFSQSRQRVKHSSPGFGATRSSKFVPLK